MKLILIGFSISLCVLLVGCVDLDGTVICKNSYDNLVLEDGWRIMGHSSSFVSGAENRYFVSFHVGHANATVDYWIHDFIYNSADDRLYYSGDDPIVIEVN